MSSRLPRAWEGWAEARSLHNLVDFYQQELQYIKEHGKLPPNTRSSVSVKLRTSGLISINYDWHKGRRFNVTELAEKLLEGET